MLLMLLVQGSGFENTGLETFLWLTSPVPSLHLDLALIDELKDLLVEAVVRLRGRGLGFLLAANRKENKNLKNVFSVVLDEGEHSYRHPARSLVCTLKWTHSSPLPPA